MTKDKLQTVPEEVRLETTIDSLGKKIGKRANAQYKREIGRPLIGGYEYVVVVETFDLNIPEAGNHDSVRVEGDGSFSNDGGYPASFDILLRDYAFVVNPEFQAIERELWAEYTANGYDSQDLKSEGNKDWNRRYDEQTQAFVNANRISLMRGFVADLRRTLAQPQLDIRSDVPQRQPSK